MSRSIFGLVVLLLHVSLIPVVNAHAGPMATPIQSSVNELGAAVFSIPIAVPPGTAGLQPNVTITYNSHQGNGLLGMGAGLSSSSTISRCPATKAQDNVIGTLNYDGDDRFCLDGQRLIAVSGVYGAEGTEYRTEISNFSKIVSYKSNTICRKNSNSVVNENTSPQFFKVWTKSGQVLEYGNSADSNVVATNSCAQTVTRAWALNRAQDIKGNFQVYTYINDVSTGNFQPLRIDYTGNALTGMAPDNSVRFEYESRTDLMSYYQAGNFSKLGVRLKEISTYVGANPVRKYKIDYINSTQTTRSLMNSVTECEATSGKCLPPTLFVWSEQLDGSIQKRWLTGYDEFSKLKIIPINNGNNQVGLIGLGPLYPSLAPKFTNFSVSGNQLNVSYWSDFIPPRVASQPPLKDDTLVWLTGDLGANGSDTLIRVVAKGDIISYSEYQSSGDGAVAINPTYKNQSARSGKFLVADIDGDYREDVISIFNDGKGKVGIDVLTREGNPKVSYRNGATTSSGPWDASQRWFAADVNNDGFTDLLAVRNDGGYATVDVYISTGTGFIYSVWSTRSGNYYNNQKWFVGDVNGDGLPDLIAVAGANGLADIDAHINTGKSFKREKWAGGAGPYWDDQKWFAGDVNGDGLIDLLNVYDDGGSATIDARISNGRGFRFVKWAVKVGAYSQSQQWWLADIYGVGGADLINVFNDQGKVSVDVHKTRLTADRIVSITSGIGLKTSYSYTAIASAYSFINEYAYRYPSARGALVVVYAATKPDGIGGVANTQYSYGVLGKDVTGRGIQGFSTITSTDVERQIKTVQRYGFRFPHSMIPSSIENRTTTEKLLSRITNLSSCWEDGSVCPNTSDYQKKFGFIREQKEEYWDLKGIPLAPSKSTSFKYDEFGNLTNSVITAKDANGIYRTTTENSYSNDTVNWFIGRLKTSTVTKETP